MTARLHVTKGSDPVKSLSFLARAERPIEVGGGADQGEVGEGLREGAQPLAAGTDLFGVRSPGVQ